MALVRPLNTNERAENPSFTHVAVITANDLTNPTLAASQTIDLCGLKIGDIIYRAVGVPVVPFRDASDGGFNTNLVSLGDTGLATRHLAATEANEAGEVRVMGNTAFLYVAADTLRATVAGMAAKALINIDIGEYHFFICLTRTDNLSNSIARTGMTK